MQRSSTKYLFSYDAAGNVVAVKYGGNYYYYLRNAQGDIVKLIDGDGATVVEYTYNTWGKKVTTTGSMAETLGRWQPFRYRGYVYDHEWGMYYLQSRYYDPTTGRFISADVMLSTGQGVLGHNCYAYCLGNPVNMRDSCGRAANNGNIHITADGNSGSMQMKQPPEKIYTFYEGQEQEAIDAFLEGKTVYYRDALLVKLKWYLKTTCSFLGKIHIDATNINVEILKHEYGHIIHEKLLGSVGYLINL